MGSRTSVHVLALVLVGSLAATGCSRCSCGRAGGDSVERAGPAAASPGPEGGGPAAGAAGGQQPKAGPAESPDAAAAQAEKPEAAPREGIPVKPGQSVEIIRARDSISQEELDKDARLQRGNLTDNQKRTLLILERLQKQKGEAPSEAAGPPPDQPPARKRSKIAD